jgi:heterodisulfide reductase subunit A-like polyferredoxin
MFDLRGDVSRHAVTAPVTGSSPVRVGVFVCQCGSLIADAIDTEAVRDRAATWPDVVHTEVLPFSCSPEAAQAMVEAIDAHGLNRAVLAACSCCPIDQVCYSCTYQRVRCKDNLGVFHPGLYPDLRGPRAARPDRPRAVWEFVNIREQCAWVHPDDRQAATAKVTALVAAAVSKVRVAALNAAVEASSVERSVLILGNGASARACQKALEAQGIATQHVTEMPTEIRRVSGRYAVARNAVVTGAKRPEGVPTKGSPGASAEWAERERSGRSGKSTWQATALVLAPHDAGEMDRLLGAFGRDGYRPRTDTAWGGLDTHRPGVWLCDPAQATAMAGAAAAARVAAWLGHLATQPQSIAAVVDTARCRACNTCVEICEFGAPQLVGDEPQRSSWIDPAICTGCGTCAAHCPSGAITAGFCPDAQLAAMLEAALACGSPTA